MAAVDIDKLSLEERLRLLDEIWESLIESPSSVAVTGAQKKELDRRLDDLEREGPVGIPWAEVLRRLQSQ